MLVGFSFWRLGPRISLLKFERLILTVIFRSARAMETSTVNSKRLCTEHGRFSERDRGALNWTPATVTRRAVEGFLPHKRVHTRVYIPALHYVNALVSMH